MTDTAPLPRPISLGEFTSLVGKTLLADCDPAPVELVLVSARELRNHAQLARPPFSLVFRSAPQAMLTSATYVIRGEGFGPDLIHLIQIAPPMGGAPGHYYEALFN